MVAPKRSIGIPPNTVDGGDPAGCRRHHRTRVFDSQSLSRRPDRVAARQEFGHWESDLTEFRREHGKVNVASLVERVSRYVVVLRDEDRRSKPIMQALIEGLAPLTAEARRSITFDRGTEFSGWLHLKAGIGADSWFCDPRRLGRKALSRPPTTGFESTSPARPARRRWQIDF